MKTWSQEEVSRYLGESMECHVSWSSREDVRDDAASGGTTSQILISLLEANQIDGALVWKLDFSAKRPAAVPFIASTPEEILSARGSEYVAVSFPRDAMPLIEGFDGQLAVVALPCDTSYLRRKMSLEPGLAAKIYTILTLFCGHNSEPELTEMFLARHGVDWRDLESFRYRRGEWRGRLDFRMKDGRRVEVPTRDYTHLQNLHLCSQKKCLSCFDHFGYEADISLGDAWSRDKKGLPEKPTLVVVRTQRGKEVIDHARDRLHLEETPPEDVVSGNSRGVIFHYNVSARADVADWFGMRINDRLDLPVTTLDRLIASFALANFKLSNTSIGKELIQRLPFAAIQAWIIAFKGLQQANVWAYRPFGAKTRISIIGATFEGNRGAEAMLETTIQQLQKIVPEAQFVVHSYFADEDREWIDEPNIEIVDASPLPLVCLYFPFSFADRLARLVGFKVPYSVMPRRIRLLASSSLLVDVSGISLADGREKFLPFNILCVLPAMWHGVPVVKLAQAMGSFDSAAVRFSAKWILNRCKLVVARGSKTLEMVRELDLRTEVMESPDLAFLFDADPDTPGWLVSFLDELDEASAQRPLVGLYVSEVVNRSCASAGIDYVSRVTSLIEKLVENGHKVVLIPNANRSIRERHNNDIPVIEDCLRALDSGDHVIALTRRCDASGLRKITEAVDVVVSSRFHGMIAALSLSKPSIVIGWGHKYEETMELFNEEGRVWDYREFDVDRIASEVDSLIEDSEAIHQKLASKLPEVRRRTMQQFDRLRELLSRRPSTQDFGEYQD